jgi:hypothetical protein
MLNENLLNTPVVKSQIQMWFYEWGNDWEEVLYKLADMHLIIITKEFLIEFMKKEKIYFEEKLKDLE